MVLTPPPDDDEPMEAEQEEEEEEGAGQFELLPMFESIAPLRVETAAGKTVHFRRRAKPRPKPIPVSPLAPVFVLSRRSGADIVRSARGRAVLDPVESIYSRSRCTSSWQRWKSSKRSKRPSGMVSLPLAFMFMSAHRQRADRVQDSKSL